MGALQVLLFVTSAVLVLENGSWKVEGAPSGTYSISTFHQPSSSNNAITPAASQTHYAISSAGTYRQSELGTSDYRRYLPVEDTPEVKKAREQFFKLYQKQASLASEAPDNHLDGAYTQTHAVAGARDDEGYTYDYYYDYEEDEDEEDEYEDEEDEEEDDDDEEEDEEDDDDEEEDEDEDEDEEEEDESDEEDEDEDDEEDSSSSSSSSSSEEDYYGYDSSEEDGGEDSSSEESSEEYGGEDSSSSSSSSSSSEEDGEARAYEPLNTNLLAAPQPVTDTPEVQQAKRNFFNLYKAQAELSFNAPDDP